MSGPSPASLPPRPAAPSALREALAARLARDVALVALVAGTSVAAAARDATAAIPQALAAAVVLLSGGRRAPLGLSVFGRLVLTFAVLVASVALGGGPQFVLARFLGGITAVTLLHPKSARDQGLLLATSLLQMALASALSSSAVGAVSGLAFLLLAHRALASFHVLGAVVAAEDSGGVVAAAAEVPRLRRQATRAAVACAALAAPLFALLPRTDFPLFRVNATRPLAVGGFGDEVTLRAMGDRFHDDVVLGDATPLDPDARDRAPYFRVRAFESFDGVTWRTADDEGVAPLFSGAETVPLAPAPLEGPVARYDLSVVPRGGDRLPLPEGAFQVEFQDGAPDHVVVERTGSVSGAWNNLPGRVRYRASAGSPGARRGASRSRGSREAHLEVPPAVDVASLSPLVEEVLRGVPDDPASRADALATWIRGRCAYGEDGPTGDRTGRRGTRDPVGEFLLRARVGHCEHFAAALAVCCRIARVPARVVAGYHASRWNEVGRFWVLRRRDAHAWVEAHVLERGWVRFDATPADAREEDPYRGLAGLLARVRDAVSHAWTRHVVGYDAQDRRALLEGAAALSASVVALVSSLPAAGAGAALAAALAGLLLVGRAGRRSGRRRASVPRAAFYRDALRLLARRGLGRRAGETAREHAVRAAPSLPPGAADALSGLGRAFEEVVYGGRPPPGPEWVAARLEALAARTDSSASPAESPTVGPLPRSTRWPRITASSRRPTTASAPTTAAAARRRPSAPPADLSHPGAEPGACGAPASAPGERTATSPRPVVPVARERGIL